MAYAPAPSTAPRATGSDESSSDCPLRELRGVVERIIFQNAEDGFAVARLAPERPENKAESARGDDQLVAVVGALADLPTGEAVAAWRSLRDEIGAWLGWAAGRRS